MSSIKRCDICKKTIKKIGYHSRTPEFDQYDYCEKCWADEKNWPKIHKVETKVAAI